MNSALRWAGWFLVCAILQSTLVPHIAIMTVKPDLPLLALFFLATKAGVMPGVLVGFFLGLGHDLFSPGLLGSNSLAMGLTGALCGLFNERVMRLDPIMRAVLMLAAFFVNDTVVMLVHLLKVDGAVSTLFMELLVVTLPRSVYTLACSAIPFIWITVIKPQRLVD
ncbi:MAG: rod shape-determining protein MreD [Chitinispirillia bacterium]|nr:rod shape-determining protein MreD [Chitinispirillia bacterium]MCL2242550.1 rod shape-determining protein MreD [Chitinispirillia bacterium]